MAICLIKGAKMRQDIKESIRDYADNHVPTGGFLAAVLCNNLKESFAQADEDNIRDMFEIVKYCYNEIPSICWGSPERVRNWLAERT